jgi:hypothetical protein
LSIFSIFGDYQKNKIIILFSISKMFFTPIIVTSFSQSSSNTQDSSSFIYQEIYNTLFTASFDQDDINFLQQNDSVTQQVITDNAENIKSHWSKPGESQLPTSPCNNPQIFPDQYLRSLIIKICSS